MTSTPGRSHSPYLFYGQTTSLCDVCLETVPAKICVEGHNVYYDKRCKQHGHRRALVSTDYDFFRWQREFLKPGDRTLKTQAKTELGCPWDCGICPDHEQHSCLALIEVNEHCNLSCPVCFAESSPARTSHLPLETIERMLDTLVESEGEPDLVQFSGGEPTLHPQFFEILAAARRRPIRHVMINTNGVRIAQEPDFVARLAENKKGFEVYLQFDSLQRDALLDLRGADLRRIRQQALENLEHHNISTTLVCTIKKGVNDAECGEIVRHALEWNCVRGVTFQPLQVAGRLENVDPARDRITLTDIRRRVIEDSGVFAAHDMIPLPCNPTAISIGYGLRNGKQVAPVTSMFTAPDMLPDIPNAIAFEKYPDLQRRIFDLFSLSTGPDTAVERISALLCCLPSFPVPQGLTYDNIFRVAIVEFMDAHNFCTANVKRSCVHFVTPEGQIVPFETYNLFHRSGKIKEIRQRLKAR